MSEISGGQTPPPPSPEEIQRYKDDYEDSLQLFRDSFNEYNKPSVEAHKKAKLKEVMDEALDVMNKTACVALKEGKKKEQEAKLNDDYEAFIQNPSDANREQVLKDLQALE